MWWRAAAAMAEGAEGAEMLARSQLALPRCSWLQERPRAGDSRTRASGRREGGWWYRSSEQRAASSKQQSSKAAKQHAAGEGAGGGGEEGGRLTNLHVGCPDSADELGDAVRRRSGRGGCSQWPGQTRPAAVSWLAGGRAQGRQRKLAWLGFGGGFLSRSGDAGDAGDADRAHGAPPLAFALAPDPMARARARGVGGTGARTQHRQQAARPAFPTWLPRQLDGAARLADGPILAGRREGATQIPSSSLSDDLSAAGCVRACVCPGKKKLGRGKTYGLDARTGRQRQARQAGGRG